MTQKRMTKELMNTLRQKIQEWRGKNPQGSMEHCIDVLQTFDVFAGWKIDSSIRNNWNKKPEDPDAPEPESDGLNKLARKYCPKGPKKKAPAADDLEELDEVLAEEKPTYGGLLKKIAETNEYALRLQKHQKEELQKVFLA